MRNDGVTTRAVADYGETLVPIFAYLAAVRAQEEAKAGAIDGKYIIVHPGEGISFATHGFCMDPNLPAPVAGERLAIVDEASLIPSVVKPVYDAVIRRSNMPGVDHGLVQATVWFIRRLGSVHVNRVDPSPMRDFVNDSYPGGWKILADYADSVLDGKEKKSNAFNLVSRLLNQTGLGSTVGSVLAQANGLIAQGNSYLASLPQLKAQTAQLMNAVTAHPPAEDIPADLSSLSKWQGLDASTRGDGVLSGQTLAVNTTNDPIVVDVSQPLVEQSERVSQRISGLPEHPTLVPETTVNPAGAGEAEKVALNAIDLLDLTPKNKIDVFKNMSNVCDLLGLKDAVGCFNRFWQNGSLTEGISGSIKVNSFVEAAREAKLAIIDAATMAWTGKDITGKSVDPATRLYSGAMLAAGGASAVLAVAATPEILAAVGAEGIALETEALLEAAGAARLRTLLAEFAGGAYNVVDTSCRLGAVPLAFTGVPDTKEGAEKLGWWGASTTDAFRDTFKQIFRK